MFPSSSRKNAIHSSWSGIFAPAGTPPEVVAEVHKAVTEVLNSSEVSGKLTELGYVIQGSSPQEFSVFFKGDIERFAKAASLAKVDKKDPNQ